MALNNTSKINSSLINSSYPVSGISQSSQGFRDNFSNIQTALSTAASEITSLNNAVNSLSGATVTFTGAVTSSQAISLSGQVSISLSLDTVNNQVQTYDSTKDDIVVTIGNDGRATVNSITPIVGNEQSLAATFSTVKNASGTSVSSINIPTFSVSSTGRIDTSSISSVTIPNFGLFGYAVKSNSVIYSNSTGTSDYLHATGAYNVLMTDGNSNIIWNKLTVENLGDVSVTTSPTAGQALVYNGTRWAPTTLSAGGIQLKGTNGIASSTSGSITSLSLNYPGMSPITPSSSSLLAVYNPSSLSYGNVSISQIASIIGANSSTSIEEDSAPTLSANLNLNGHGIISNSNISIQTTNGSITIGSIKIPSSLPSSSSVLMCDTSGNITWGSFTSTGGTITVGDGLSLTSSGSTDKINLAFDRLQLWDGGTGPSTMNTGDMMVVYTSPSSTSVQTTNPGAGNQGYCYITPTNIVNYMKSYFIYNGTLTTDLILNNHNITSGYDITISNTSAAVVGSTPNITIAASGKVNQSGTTISTSASTQINQTAPTILLTGSGSGRTGTVTVTDAIQIIGDSVSISASSGNMNLASGNMSCVTSTYSGNYTSSFTLQYVGEKFVSLGSTNQLVLGNSAFSTDIEASAITINSAGSFVSQSHGDTTITSASGNIKILTTTGSLTAIASSIAVVATKNVSATAGSATVSISPNSAIFGFGSNNAMISSAGISLSSKSSNINFDDTDGKLVITTSGGNKVSSTVVIEDNEIDITTSTFKINGAAWPAGAPPHNSFLITDSSGNMQWTALTGGSSSSIGSLTTKVNKLSTNVGTLQTSVSTNTTDIANIKKQQDANIASITTLNSEMSSNQTNISNIQTATTTNTSNVTLIKAKVANLSTDGSSYAGSIDNSTYTFNGSPATISSKFLQSVTVKDFGAKVDGTTDDTLALKNYINYKILNIGTGKSIYIDIPEGTMVISGPPMDTGAYNIMLRGKGMLISNIKMTSGGSGIWTHGSTTTPATGILQIEDLTMVDGNGSGSGVFAVTCSFAESSTQDLDTITINNVEFRSFSKCMNIIDMPRNCYVNNMLCYGPDNTYQKNGAIIISTTSASKFGNFTWVWTKCMISNYEWGWDYSSVTPMEGPRYYSCTCYNGWGMIRAAIQNSANGITVNDYQSPCWYITDCDWQGMGFALDLYNVRNVIVRGGFYFPNSCATSDYATKLPNDPMGNARTHRSIMAFYYGDVILDGVEFDNGGGSFNSVDTIVFVNKNVSTFRAINTNFIAPDKCLAAFEYESGGKSSRCGAYDSIWGEFGGQIKILDHDNNQINQEAVQDRATGVYIGQVNKDGMYMIHNIIRATVANGNNRVSVTFPTRPAVKYNSDKNTYTNTTAPLFIGSDPVVNFNVLNASPHSAAVSTTLISVDNNGFTFEYNGASSNYQADVFYTAVGY